MQNNQNARPEHKTPAQVKWRDDPRDYQYPRTSRDAFGYDLRDEDFEVSNLPSMHTGDMVVVVGSVLAVLVLYIVL